MSSSDRAARGAGSGAGVPEVVPICYGRMSASPFAVFRGAAYVMAPAAGALSVRRPRAQGRRRGERGSALLGDFAAGTRPERRAVASGKGGAALLTRAVRRPEWVLQPGAAGGRGPAADAGRYRHRFLGWLGEPPGTEDLSCTTFTSISYGLEDIGRHRGDITVRYVPLRGVLRVGARPSSRAVRRLDCSRELPRFVRGVRSRHRRLRRPSTTAPRSSTP
jgi:hypothetical protein